MNQIFFDVYIWIVFMVQMRSQNQYNIKEGEELKMKANLLKISIVNHLIKILSM